MFLLNPQGRLVVKRISPYIPEKSFIPKKNIARDVSPGRVFIILYSIVFQSLSILFSLSNETPTLMSLRLSAA